MLAKVSTYHRFISPTQTSQDLQKQIQSQEIWGQPARNVYQSDIPKVKAFVGKLPKGKKGIEFTTDILPDPNTPPYLATTDILPDPNTPPYLATWSGERLGVRTEDGYAKLKVLTITAVL